MLIHIKNFPKNVHQLLCPLNQSKGHSTEIWKVEKKQPIILTKQWWAVRGFQQMADVTVGQAFQNVILHITNFRDVGKRIHWQRYLENPDLLADIPQPFLHLESLQSPALIPFQFEIPRAISFLLTNS